MQRGDETCAQKTPFEVTAEVLNLHGHSGETMKSNESTNATTTAPINGLRLLVICLRAQFDFGWLLAGAIG